MRVVDCPEVWPRTCSGGSWGDTRVLSYSGLVGGGKCSHLLGDLGRIEKRGVEGRISWGRKEEARLLLLTPHLLVGILRSVGRHISGSADRECKMTVLLHYSIEPRMRLVNKTTHITATTTTIDMSEIDHIFSKPKSSPVRSSSAKKRRKKNITKPAIPLSPPSSRKRPLPETVVDTSHNSSGPSKRRKHVNDTNSNPRKSVKIGPAVDPAFKDSRGTSNRRYIAP